MSRRSTKKVATNQEEIKVYTNEVMTYVQDLEEELDAIAASVVPETDNPQSLLQKLRDQGTSKRQIFLSLNRIFNMTTKEIAKLTGDRYQHVYNTLAGKQ